MMQTKETTDSSQAWCYRKAKCCSSADPQRFLPSQPCCTGPESQILWRRIHSHVPAPPVIHAVPSHQQLPRRHTLEASSHAQT